jgi:peptide/nickel transport system substrate-binding protein
MGQMLKAIESEIPAVDDRTFRWVLTKPYPKILLALGKIGTPCCFVMPARIAATNPFQQINDYVGSGPMRFLRDEWNPGAKAVFEKFPGYAPRQEPASWLAGGKRIISDRIEWVIIPDAGYGRAAERRSGLVGDTASRPCTATTKEPQRIGGYRRPLGQHRHTVLQSPVPTLQ